MSAELIDPFAPKHPENLTPDEWIAIRDEIQDAPWTDPQRYPELVAEALRTLGEIGMGNTADPARAATQCLRRMVYRAHTGVPFADEQDLWPDREPFIRHVDDVAEDL